MMFFEVLAIIQQPETEQQWRRVVNFLALIKTQDCQPEWITICSVDITDPIYRILRTQDLAAIRKYK